MDKKSTVEFEWFTAVQNNLIKVFLKEGHARLESEELGFLVAQGVRDVPHLLALLNDIEQHSSDEVMNAVFAVLANRKSLDDAFNLLMREQK